VTNEGLVPIFGPYVIDRPSTSRETGRLRCAGFQPGDNVLVVGTTAKGGISAVEVSGGTRAEFRKTLEERRVLSVAGRYVGLLMMGVGLPPALWAASRIRRRRRSRRASAETWPTI
jgi:hypothetical protein